MTVKKKPNKKKIDWDLVCPRLSRLRAMDATAAALAEIETAVPLRRALILTFRDTDRPGALPFEIAISRRADKAAVERVLQRALKAVQEISVD